MSRGLRLARLNGDATWWVGLGGGVLFDPWLTGAEVDGFPAFHAAWHTSPCVAPEAVPAHALCVVSNPYADHLHPETLVRLSGGAPVAAHPAAVRGVQRALPGRTVHAIPPWGAAPATVGDLRVWRVSPPWWRVPPYHAVVVADGQGTAVVHAPHGLDAGVARSIGRTLDVAVFACTRVPYLLPPLLGGRANPGPAAADAACDALRARAAFAIHDEAKREVGLIAWLARRDPSVDDAPPGTAWRRVRGVDPQTWVLPQRTPFA